METQTINQKITKKLTEYLKERGAISAELVAGPHGDFVSAKKADDSVFTLPVGKKSQSGNLKEMNVLITEDTSRPGEDIAIATMNNYETLDVITL